MASTPTSEEITGSIDDQLERLLAFEPVALPVVSVYLNTQPGGNGRAPELQPYLQREFKSLAGAWPSGSPERESFDRDSERILEYVASIDPAANGVAIFAC